jgi:dihydroflavonol-4-reductase
MKALVTGATGFVGSAVVRELLLHDWNVRALIRSRSDRRNITDVPVEIIEGDLNDSACLDPACEDCDALFHVAADYRLWARNPEELYATNVQGTYNIMDAAMRVDVKRIVYTSSVAVLGLPRDGVCADESTPTTLEEMVGHYKRSKYLAEESVRALIQQGAPIIIVNPSTPLGPRDVKPTPTGRIVVDAARGRMPAYVDTGLNIVHVDDVAHGHLLAWERGRVGERYVLGGENASLQTLLTEIATIVGRKPPTIRLPHRLVTPFAYVAEALALIRNKAPQLTVDSMRMAQKKMFFSSAKAEQELGYRARPMREAVVDAVRWFEENGYLK